MGSVPITLENLDHTSIMTRERCDKIHTPLNKSMGEIRLDVHDMKRDVSDLKTGQNEMMEMLREFQLLSLLANTMKRHKAVTVGIITALISALGIGSYLGFSG